MGKLPEFLAFRASPESANSFLPDKIQTMATWSLAGFTALNGILGYLGIKDGVLDQMLRLSATTSMYIFCLLGLGIICALLATALDPAERMYLSAALSSALVLGCLSLVMYDNFHDKHYTWITFLLALSLPALTLVVIWVARNGTTSTAAGVLIIGVAATSMGLYGATKLAVSAKSLPVSPRVTASLTVANDSDTLNVAVAAHGNTKNVPLVIRVYRTTSEPRTLIGRARLYPDQTGETSAQLTFPVPHAPAWEQLAVMQCMRSACNEVALISSPHSAVEASAMPNSLSAPSLATSSR